MKKLSYIFLFIVMALATGLHVKHRLSLGAQAYVYGFPLVLMDATQNADIAGMGVNRIGHRMTLPDHTFRAVVRPNNDTVYSIAWLDLSQQPQVLSLPDMGSRYYVMPFMDAWTNVFARLGSSTTGQQAGDYILVGPNWQGKLPDDIKVIKAPSNRVWLIGRSQLNGKQDLPALEKKLASIALTDLENFVQGRRFYSQKITKETGPDLMAEVEAMDEQDFFAKLNQQMAKQPPAKADAELLEQLEFIHIGPGLDFGKNLLLDPWIIAKGASMAKQKLQQQKNVDRSAVNGWAIIRDGIGRYGTDYKTRAYVALVGLGALPPEEASYPNTFKDSNGQRLNGHSRYRLHFKPGQTPPANAFWSITLYDRDGFMIANSINRYAIGDRDGLLYNDDGSLDIIIQQPATEIQNNWLPAPAGDFSITMRVYLPSKRFLSGGWQPPAVEKLP